MTYVEGSAESIQGIKKTERFSEYGTLLRITGEETTYQIFEISMQYVRLFRITTYSLRDENLFGVSFCSLPNWQPPKNFALLYGQHRSSTGWTTIIKRIRTYIKGPNHWPQESCDSILICLKIRCISIWWAQIKIPIGLK